MFLIKIFKYIYREIRSLIEMLIRVYPDTRIGFAMREAYWRCRGIQFGTAPRLCQMSVFEPGPLSLGHHLNIGKMTRVCPSNSEGIFIGHNVAIAEGTYIRAANHNFQDTNVPIALQGHSCVTIPYHEKKYSIVIEDDVWIGAQCIILSGAKIGTGTVIAAGSVVSTEIPPYSVVVGNPARVIMNRLKRFSALGK